MEIVSYSAIGLRYQLLTSPSYIVYIAVIAMYLVLILFYFPETKGMTIEEVSMLFDTGRKGDAAAAAAKLDATGKAGKAGVMGEEEDDVEKTPAVVSHAERN